MRSVKSFYVFFVISFLLLNLNAKSKFNFPENIKKFAIIQTKNTAGTDDEKALRDIRWLVGGMLNERTRFEFVKFNVIDSTVNALGIDLNKIDADDIKNICENTGADGIIIPEIITLIRKKGITNAKYIAEVKVTAYDSNGNKIFENAGSYSMKKPLLASSISDKLGSKVGAGSPFYEVIRDAVYRAIKPFPKGKK